MTHEGANIVEFWFDETRLAYAIMYMYCKEVLQCLGGFNVRLNYT